MISSVDAVFGSFICSSSPELVRPSLNLAAQNYAMVNDGAKSPCTTYNSFLLCCLTEEEMRGFHSFALIIAVFVVYLNPINAETLRQRIFGSNDELCDFSEYRCGNNACIRRNQLCDNRNDCGDNSDEEYCHHRDCPPYRAFLCNRYQYSKCIPKSWQCDGIEDCHGGKDENECYENKGRLIRGLLYKSTILAQNWTRMLRKKEFSVQKWGSDVERIAVALYLSNRTIFSGNDTVRDEIAYELSLGLLSRLALKQVEDISSTEIAFYVNAFLVSCIDPRKFHVLDLVRELRKRADAQNYTNPSIMLALCNAGEKITAQDVEKLTAVFWKAHEQFWTDAQALVILALSCAARQTHKVINLEEISDLTMELKKKQYRNGTVENLKTTALVMQALFASEHEADENNFDEEKALEQILHAQEDDGSF
ncbi:uncharacterized protein NPIL_15141, partial [Nephila pilipes]